ncbi:hypothetical protein CDD83_146 [Cordyceps sp. RAO-2017]|nr:hypothetical protein CDD83_146 [Cordyceps sp. RAO-2017]
MRRVWRRELDYTTPVRQVQEWFNASGITLGPLVTDDLKEEIMRTFFSYRDLNGATLHDIPPTDLFVHKPRLQEGVKPWNKSPRRRWNEPQRYWLNKLTQDCIDAGMYEYTSVANGSLSAWSAEPVLVPKDENDPWAEQRLTVNYRNVKEDLPGTEIPLLAELHEQLSDPRVGAYSGFDLKHGYWAVEVEPSLRFCLAFRVPGYAQLQPTRMPQGTSSACHSFSELMKLALGSIPGPYPEPSLLSPAGPGMAPVLNYIDDVFCLHQAFPEQWAFIRDHLLPRFSWALLRLSFKKVQIGMTEVTAIGWIHRVNGETLVKPSRTDKLKKWPVPVNQTQVRGFIGAMGPTRQWIPNCAELARPLCRLMGNVEWQWGASEALSFTILRAQLAATVAKHGHQPDQCVQMYSDASGYGGGCVILQSRMQDGKQVTVPILYDSFLLTKTQRGYGTYKRELCVLAEFCRRHKHYFLARETSVIYTDHMPLTWFLDGGNHEGIYARWVTELRTLNVVIKYIEGKRNAAADALSRTIFPDDDCLLADWSNYGQMDDDTGLWIWKDGANGYEHMLQHLRGDKSAKVPVDRHGKQVPELTLSQWEQLRRSWGWNDSTLKSRRAAVIQSNSAMVESDKDGPKATLETRLQSGDCLTPKNDPIQASIAAYLDTTWYWQTVNFLMTGDMGDEVNRHRRNRMRHKCRLYRWSGTHLQHKDTAGLWRRCLLPDEVPVALELAHDKAGHFGVDSTRKRLSSQVFWPGMVADIVLYVDSCLQCAEHNPRTGRSPDQPVEVDEPLQLLGLDHVGPFPGSPKGLKYILVMVDYFSRACWLHACRTTGASEAIRKVESWLQAMMTTPMAFYTDPGSAFTSAEFATFMGKENIVMATAPTKSHKSVGMVEVCNKIMQITLNKVKHLEQHWPDSLPGVEKMMNHRIIQHLGYSPAQILYGFEDKRLSNQFPTAGESEETDMRTALRQGTASWPIAGRHADLVVRRMAMLTAVRDCVSEVDDARNLARLRRHESRSTKPLQPGDLVMVAREGKPRKLESRFTGPFRIRTRKGRATYALEHRDGAKIRNAHNLDFHEDDLRKISVRPLRLGNPVEFPWHPKLR